MSSRSPDGAKEPASGDRQLHGLLRREPGRQLNRQPLAAVSPRLDRPVGHAARRNRLDRVDDPTRRHVGLDRKLRIAGNVELRRDAGRRLLAVKLDRRAGQHVHFRRAARERHLDRRVAIERLELHRLAGPRGRQGAGARLAQLSGTMRSAASGSGVKQRDAPFQPEQPFGADARQPPRPIEHRPADGAEPNDAVRVADRLGKSQRDARAAVGRRRGRPRNRDVAQPGRHQLQLGIQQHA